MEYASYSLNGAWEMNYCEHVYTGRENPWKKGTLVENAVPGYWEDMTEQFMVTPFFRSLRVNPEYGLQQYPIADSAPDMALPNIMGNFYYRREFNYQGNKERMVLHFEGVQNAVSVWVNDIYLGRHEGYSTPFDVVLPVKVVADGVNTIVLSVSNYRLEGYHGQPVSGITSRAANEYSGGITGAVELRVYNSLLRDVVVRISDDCKRAGVEICTHEDYADENLTFEWFVYDDKVLLKAGVAEGDFTFDTEGLKYWSPEHPKQYRLEIHCGECVMTRSFGVRRLLADGVHFTLNGQPYFLRGLCEHGHFTETIHPHHDISVYREAIKTEKKLGFNFIRFHTFIPTEEYMQAADELGMLLHVESPNNTSLKEWKEIVNFCRRHTSVVIYCCGNELLMDDPFIEHIRQCAEEVHEKTDALFSPMSAMRGLEYYWGEKEQVPQTVERPFQHHPRRLKTVGAFADLYSSYALGYLSYCSLDADVDVLDEWSKVYGKPRVSHEICIDGTYVDLSLKDRYQGNRMGLTDRLPSIERHLEAKGLLKNAPLYFKNSSEWQRRIRKYCFEIARRCENMAGFDFLGPIDTHWHTFGYEVGMMNEFYELKPGETIRNVLMYNSATVLLTDLGTDVNVTAGTQLSFGVYTSHYGARKLEHAWLQIMLLLDGRVIERRRVELGRVENGKVSKLYDFTMMLPEVSKPGAMKLYITMDGEETFAENEWELYLFPKSLHQGEKAEEKEVPEKQLLITEGMCAEELEDALAQGKDVLLLGAEPFVSLPTTFRIALAGRTSGNLATVIRDHPIFDELPHDGFCGWQFRRLMEEGNAICFESDKVPFHPIVEVVSTYKYAIRQGALFEFEAINGRLLVCSFHFQETDPAAVWLKEQLINYVQSEKFQPKDQLDRVGLRELISGKVVQLAGNTNFAFNVNDITARRQ